MFFLPTPYYTFRSDYDTISLHLTREGMSILDKGTVKDINFYSEALQEELQLLIYIPANYSPLYKYNLLIAADGKDYFQLGSIPRLADELIDNYEMENTIIVGVPYKNVADRQKNISPLVNNMRHFYAF